MYRQGGLSEFTTLSVERYLNATVTPDVWQTTTLDDEATVWQTNEDGDFCTQGDECTFAEFKAEYPDAAMIGLQVAIGTNVPVTTSYVDGVSLTITETTDTWDFEPAAEPEPTPTPTPEPTPTPDATPVPGASPTPDVEPTITLPPTDVGGPTSPWQAIDGRLLLIVGAVIAFALLSLREFAYRRIR